MFGIGMPELIIILVIALLVIGPKKLPDLAKSLGRGLSEFKKATEDFQRTVQEESKKNDEKPATPQQVSSENKQDVTQQPFVPAQAVQAAQAAQAAQAVQAAQAAQAAKPEASHGTPAEKGDSVVTAGGEPAKKEGITS